ncbi:MAG: hypothetical protein IJA49_06670 [Oscillospiraceae bacterium]|nr:hypothetical protein [Oscillospiraceae bacterium]
MSFTDVLNLSISASWLVLAVFLARLLLKKAPKALHCALWALVAIRLLCPFSIESAVSLIPSREVVSHDYLVMEPNDEEFTQSASLNIVTNPVYDTTMSIEIEPTVDRLQHWDMVGTVVWLTGMAAMGIYAVYSYLNLRLRVRMSARISGNIWECDDLSSPFILGILRPRIYLPSELDEQTRQHVLAHERAHLSRLDHLWKPLGFLLLTVHWFNPLLWLAYVLLCRDIELACDEKVVKRLGRAEVVEYSNALIRCAVPHRAIALCPLAFGEVGVKNRIRAILNYKKPGFWVLLLAAILCVALAVGFLTDPADPEKETVPEPAAYTPESLIGQELYLSEVLFSDQDKGLPYTRENAPVYTLTREDGEEIYLNSTSSGALWKNYDVLGYLVPSRLSADDFSAHVYGERTLHELLSGENSIFWQLQSDDAMTNLHHMLILPEEGGIYLAALEKETNDLRDLYRLTPGEAEPPQRTLASAYLLDRSAYAPYFQLSDGRFVLTQFPDQDVKITGHYDLTDTTLTLHGGDGQVWVFHMDEFDRMKFDARHSDELPIRTDYGERYLTDGAVFDPAYGGDPSYSVSISGLAPGEKRTGELFTIEQDNASILIRASYVSLFPELTVGVEDSSGNSRIESVTNGQNKIEFTRLQPGQYRVYVINNSSDRTVDWGTVRFSPSGHTCDVLGSEIQDQEDHKIYESALDRAITQVIHDENRTPLSPERICITAYEIMDQEELCIDGEPGCMVTTLYLLLRYQEYTSANNVLRLEVDTYTPAIVKLTESGGVYTPTQYWTPRPGADYETDIAEHFTSKSREFLTWVEESTRESLDLRCRELAQLRLDAGDLSAPESVATIRNYRLSGTDSLTGPSLSLCTDGTFSFSENPLSSYLGLGVYTLSDYELVLRTTDGRHTWVFTPDGNDFLFKAEGSSIVSYYPDLKNAIRLPDGARFTETEHHAVGTDHLGEAISQAILGHYDRTAKDSARVQAHEILDSQTVCGVAPAGGNGGNKEMMVVYALTRYEEYLGNALLTQETIPAVLTFEITPEGYVLQSYETPRSGDHYQSDMEKLFSKAALTRLNKEEYELNRILADSCAYQATLHSIASQETEPQSPGTQP